MVTLPHSKRGLRLGPLLLAIILFSASAVFLAAVHRHYPVQDWLFWRYATYWLLGVAFSACCGALGFAAVRLLGGPGLPLRERLVYAMPVGALAFVLLWSALGFLGLFGPVTFVLAPLGCLVLGLRGALPSLRRVFRHRRLFVAMRRPPSLLGYVFLVFGLFGLLLVYIPILTPENLAFDARWYHMPLAERYSDAGRITRFPEGWVPGGYPQFASLVYTWAFALPNATVFDRIELAAHLEFVLFLATIACLPVAVRRVLPPHIKGRMGFAWVALFVFPGMFLYDSSLTGAADHVAAFWAVPLFLSLLRAQRALSLRPSVLFALIASGVLMTKYTAYALLPFPALVLAVRAIVIAYQRLRGRTRSNTWFLAPLAILGTLAVCVAPHWLKNLVWYGDPLFPILYETFTPDPWVAEAPARSLFFMMTQEWKAERSWAGVLKTLQALYSFSFVPNNWATFHRDVPVFGSLFTLTVPLLLFFWRARTLVLLYVTAHASICFWYWNFHQDRYLQTLLPWMATGTAAILVWLWQMGTLVRVGCALLVALQVIWGGDVPFFPTHAMIAGTPYKTSIDFLSGGFRGARDERFEVYGPIAKMNDALPKNAKVLLHEEQLHLGIGAPTVSDWFQTGISYVRTPHPDAMYDLLRSFGVTHILSAPELSKGHDSVGGDIAFRYFLTNHTRSAKRYGPWTLYTLPQKRPGRGAFRDQALVLGCNESYRNGLYRIGELSVAPKHGVQRPRRDFPAPRQPIASESEASTLMDAVDAIYLNASCFKLQVPLGRRGFVLGAKRAPYEIWVTQVKRRSRRG